MKDFLLSQVKTNPVKEGRISRNSAGIGSVTRTMVPARADELGVINGRLARAASRSDRDEAKRDLTGDPDTDSNERILQSAPEQSAHGSQ